MATEKLCEWCGERPAVGYKYCEVCQKNYQDIYRAKKYNLEIRDFSKPKMCICCGKNPVPYGKYKYCKICSAHANSINTRLRRGTDPSSLWFTGNKLCECCGTRPIAEHSHKYCEECSSSYLWIYRVKDLKAIEADQPLKLCVRCKTNERMVGRCYCRECYNQIVLENYHKRHPPVHVEPKSKLCVRCHQHEKYCHNKYCYECLKYNQRIYQYTGRYLDFFKPVANPEAYYTEASKELTCPICRAEFCLRGLPLGIHCKNRILRRYKSTTWQEVLKLQSIRVPTFDEIAPELDKCWEVCIKCKTNPRMSGYLFCQDCLNVIYQEHTHC